MSDFVPSNNEAILLCRVSHEKQAEGYSLDFQEKGGRKYAERQWLKITKIWSFVESASKQGRKQWQEFLEYVKNGPEQHILIPKVDRSLRNFDDLALISKIPKLYGKVLHFFDDGIVFHRDSPAADLLRLGIQGSVATWYAADLAQKTKRGLDEKAAQGEWPEIAPYGYRNDKATKLIVVDPERAHWVRRIKELSTLGLYSLERIQKMLIDEGYPTQKHRLHTNLIERIIRNPIYAGRFEWPKGSGTLIKGKHEPIVSWEVHEAAVRGLERYGKPKGRKRDFAYAGLIRCGLCPEKRAVVLEIKKGRYIYAHCSGVRKPNLCPQSEYVRLETLEEQFLAALRRVQLTEEVADFILAELAMDVDKEAADKVAQLALIKQEIGRLEGRIRQAYVDKLDGKVAEDQWAMLNRDWQMEKASLEEKAKRLEASGPASYLPTARKLLELSKRLENLYFSANQAERRELLDTVCSNFFLRGKNLDFTYRKPFDLWAKGLQTANWLPG